MNRFLSTSVISNVTLALLLQASAEDWPQFRGPHGDGHSAASNVPLTWSETENIAWKTPVPGKGWSSPVLVGDRIYLTSAVAAGDDQDALKVDRSLRALAIDAGSGAIVWDVEVFQQPAASAPQIHRKNSHASATALVEDGRVYVHFGHMGTACLDRDGKILWKNQELKYTPVHGNGGCPIIVGDHLIFSGDGGSDPFIVALKKDTGVIAWKQPRVTDASRTFSFSTPSYFEIDGVPQVITPGSNGVSALNPQTGEELWRCNYDGYSVIPKPLLGHGLLYIGTGYDNATLMAIKPGKTGEVSATNVAWVIEKRAPHTPSFLLIGDELYFVADNGMVTCVDARTGSIHWQERSGGRAFSASPIFADGRIYLQEEHGLSLVLAPGKEFKVLAKNQLDGATLASPTPADGALYIRSATHLYKVSGPGQDRASLRHLPETSDHPHGQCRGQLSWEQADEILQMDIRRQNNKTKRSIGKVPVRLWDGAMLSGSGSMWACPPIRLARSPSFPAHFRKVNNDHSFDLEGRNFEISET